MARGADVLLGLALLPRALGFPAEAPPMTAIPRVRSDDLHVDDFVERYVSQRQPVIIEGTEMPAWDLDSISRQCGERVFELASGPQRQFLLGCPDELLDKMIDVVEAITGEAALAVFDRHLFDQITVKSFLDDIRQQESSNPSADSWRSNLADKIHAATGGDEFLSAVVGLSLRPPYLNDRPLASWCPQMLENVTVSKYHVRNWLCVVPEMVHRCPTEELRIFIGPANSMSYPMHKNILDFDALISLVSGRKQFAIFPPGMEPYLGRFDEMAQVIWYRVDGLEEAAGNRTNGELRGGWSGELGQGDLLYMPGNFPHQFRNLETSISHVAWYADRGDLERRPVGGIQANSHPEMLRDAALRMDLVAQAGMSQSSSAGTGRPVSLPFKRYKELVEEAMGAELPPGLEARRREL